MFEPSINMNWTDFTLFSPFSLFMPSKYVELISQMGWSRHGVKSYSKTPRENDKKILVLSQFEIPPPDFRPLIFYANGWQFDLEPLLIQPTLVFFYRYTRSKQTEIWADKKKELEMSRDDESALLYSLQAVFFTVIWSWIIPFVTLTPL